MNFFTYIVSALRTFPAKGRKNLLKTLTLGIGLAVGLVLTSKVCLEQTYDDYFTDSDRIYYLCETAEMNGRLVVYPQTSGGVAKTMKSHFPQIEEGTRYTWLEENFDIKMSDEGGRIKADLLFAADSSLFHVLDRKCLAGDITDALSVKNNVAVSESLARRIAGRQIENAIGKRFTIPGAGGGCELTICGVYENFLPNTSYRPDIVVSMPSIGQFTYDGSENLVGNDRYHSYIKLRPGSDASEIEDGMRQYIEAYYPVEAMKEAKVEISYLLKPASDYHYNENEGQKNMTLVLGIVALALLLTSMLNYLLIVLSTTVVRSREIALRKCIGGGNADIFGMMCAEALVHTLAAVALAAVLIFAFRGAVEDLLGVKALDLFTGEPLRVAIGVIVTLFVLGSIVPAWVFCKIPIATAFRNYRENRRVWKLALLAVEFAAVSFIAVLLSIISMQYGKMANTDPGFKYGNVAHLEMPEATQVQVRTLMNEIRAMSEVDDAAFTSTNVLSEANGDNVSLPGEPEQLFNFKDMFYVDGHFFNVMGIDIVEGRNFNTDLRADREMVVDRKFAEMLRNSTNSDEVLGRELTVTGHFFDQAETPLVICGIFEDVHIGEYVSNYLNDRPMAFFYCDPDMNLSGNLYDHIFIKYHKMTQDALEATQKVVDKILPEQSVTLTPCRTIVLGHYAATRKMRDAVLAGGLVTLLIAILGLVGYTVDEVKRRSKEIAVRRVNGAQFSEIRTMFLGDIMKIAVPSVVIGCILAGIAANRWMQQFSLQVGLPWWVFVGVALLVLIVIGAISDLQVNGISRRNPAESIRTE